MEWISKRKNNTWLSKLFKKRAHEYYFDHFWFLNWFWRWFLGVQQRNTFAFFLPLTCTLRFQCDLHARTKPRKAQNDKLRLSSLKVCGCTQNHGRHKTTSLDRAPSECSTSIHAHSIAILRLATLDNVINRQPI
jgi:hypothetical protein